MLINTQIVPQIDLAYTDCKGHPGISMDVLWYTHLCSFSKNRQQFTVCSTHPPSFIQVKAPTNSFGSQAGYKAIIT